MIKPYINNGSSIINSWRLNIANSLAKPLTYLQKLGAFPVSSRSGKRERWPRRIVYMRERHMQCLPQQARELKRFEKETYCRGR